MLRGKKEKERRGGEPGEEGIAVIPSSYIICMFEILKRWPIEIIERLWGQGMGVARKHSV